MSMKYPDLQIHVLVDNRAMPGYMPEHGLALYIEHGDSRILFDTGQGDALEPNVKAMSLDLSRTNAIVLSHGHYDHTGGLPYAIGQAPRAHIYAHPAVLSERYSIHDKSKPRDISIPEPAIKALHQCDAMRLSWIQEPCYIEAGLGLSGTIPRKDPVENVGGPFFQDRQGKVADELPDDMAIWIERDGGVIIITGCCHSGLINTIEAIRNACGRKKIKGIIGGLHLVNASEERLQHTLSALDAYQPEFVAACHCTGDPAIAALAEKFGDRFMPVQAGLTIPAEITA